MKAQLELKRQSLPPYRNEGLWRTLRRSAKVHGYRCVLWFAVVRLKDHLLNIWAATAPWNGLRVTMQRCRGVRIGNHVHIGPGCTIDFPYPYFVTIEDGVSLAGNVYVLAHNTPTEYHAANAESFVAPTTIRRNAWIGINVTVMPGVEIGEGAIVATGSIVTKDVEPHTMVAGVPARTVKTLEHGHGLHTE